MKLGGVENAVREIAKRLSKKHEVFLIVRDRPQNTNKFEKFWKEVFVVPESDNYLNFIKKRKEVEKFVKTRNIDIVNFHNWSPAFPFIFSKFKKVLTFHGTSTEQAIVDRRWLKVPIMWLIEEITANSMDAVTSITEFHMRLFKILKPLHIIPNGVDTEFFDPRKVDRKKIRKKLGLTKPTALFVGKFMPVKGLRHFIEIAKEVSDWEFIVVGDGEERYLLEDAPKNLKWLGPIYDKKKLREVYGACDVLVIPSENEGLPLVLLEGMAMELPVVCSRAGGLPEIVEAAGCGVVVRPKDVSEFVRVISNSGKRAVSNWKEQGRFFIKNNLDWKIVVKDLVIVFEGVIK